MKNTEALVPTQEEALVEATKVAKTGRKGVLVAVGGAAVIAGGIAVWKFVVKPIRDKKRNGRVHAVKVVDFKDTESGDEMEDSEYSEN